MVPAACTTASLLKGCIMLQLDCAAYCKWGSLPVGCLGRTLNGLSCVKGCMIGGIPGLLMTWSAPWLHVQARVQARGAASHGESLQSCELQPLLPGSSPRTVRWAICCIWLTHWNAGLSLLDSQRSAACAYGLNACIMRCPSISLCCASYIIIRNAPLSMNELNLCCSALHLRTASLSTEGGRA